MTPPPLSNKRTSLPRSQGRAPNLPALQLTGVGKSYSGNTAKPALSGIDLCLYPGQMTVLLGPNGAGKSTLMQLLTGLFSPDTGQIKILGYDIQSQATAALAHIGVVFQQPALDLDLDILSNLRFHTDLHGIPRSTANSRIQQGLAELGLHGQEHSKIRTLSGGNRRKIELVRALLHRPRLLLMDEATVGLDMVSRAQLLRSVHSLVRQHGLCCLWATHIADEAEAADHLLVLDQGKIHFDGQPEGFIQQKKAASLQQAYLLAFQGTSAV